MVQYTAMYDSFSDDYDRFVNWQSRLPAEMPFIESQLDLLGAEDRQKVRILDAACGTGMHAIALAQRGYTPAGADLSTAMITRAQANAAHAGVPVRFEATGFGELAGVFGIHAFEALLCLGNSLPHVLEQTELEKTLADFAACLSPGGILVIQNRNFDAVLNRKERWMDPQAYKEGLSERIFLRFYDFDPDGLITFNIITLSRDSGMEWNQQVRSTRLQPLLQSELTQHLRAAGFKQLNYYGNLAGAPFDPASSGNLVLVGRR